MKFPSRETVELIRKEYPVGSRVELIYMDDVQSPPAGTKGTVTGVDDIGSVMINWDNDSSLNAVFGVDIIRLLPKLSDKVREQILTLRTLSDCPNMFDTNAVQRLAYKNGFYELVNFIRTDCKAYAAFILTGEVE